VRKNVLVIFQGHRVVEKRRAQALPYLGRCDFFAKEFINMKEVDYEAIDA